MKKSLLRQIIKEELLQEADNSKGGVYTYKNAKKFSIYDVLENVLYDLTNLPQGDRLKVMKRLKDEMKIASKKSGYIK